MKIYIYFCTAIVSFISGCATQPKQSEWITTDPSIPNTPAVSNYFAVRRPEIIKSYPHGRYIDPNDPDTMYPEGTVYRKEQDATWNLAPETVQTVVQQGPGVTNVAPSNTPNPYTADFEQELQRQKEITDAMVEMTSTLQKEREGQNKRIEQLEAMASENRSLQAEMRMMSEVLQRKQKETTPSVAKTPPLLQTNTFSSAPKKAWWEQFWKK